MKTPDRARRFCLADSASEFDVPELASFVGDARTYADNWARALFQREQARRSAVIRSSDFTLPRMDRIVDMMSTLQGQESARTYEAKLRSGQVDMSDVSPTGDLNDRMRAVIWNVARGLASEELHIWSRGEFRKVVCPGVNAITYPAPQNSFVILFQSWSACSITTMLILKFLRAFLDQSPSGFQTAAALSDYIQAQHGQSGAIRGPGDFILSPPIFSDTGWLASADQWHQKQCVLVVLHEFAHVALGHIETIRAGGTSTWTDGDYRNAELAADQWAIDRLLRAGCPTGDVADAFGLMLFPWQVLAELELQEDGVSRSDEHPLPSERLRAVRESCAQRRNGQMEAGVLWGDGGVFDRQFENVARLVAQAAGAASERKR